MKASKAAKAPKKPKKLERTVTFRLTLEAHQALVDYALALGVERGKRVSNTEALLHMLTSAKPPTRRRATDATLATGS